MKVKFIGSAILFVTVLCFSLVSALAQESEPVVIDEVVAQVNDSVITLSGVKKEMKALSDQLVRDGKTPEAAKAEAEQKKGEIIAGLIDGELILQKGKDLGVDADVDAQINQRFLQFMKQGNLKTIDELYKAMNAAGVKPEELRESLRKQITKEMVLQHDVTSKVYYSWSNQEMKDYYEKHKADFTKPETVSLSEIFLGFAGKDEAAVRAKADQLIAQAKTGADFAKLAAENSEREDAAQTKGSVGTIPVKELNPQIAEAIKGLKVGDIAKITVDEGVEIIRVDNRAASNDSVFDEKRVREAMTAEAFPAEQKKYVAGLRKDAYIKISDAYSPLVAPFLNDTTATAETKKTSK
ncbi:MAG: peptidylprolyl isomerase [Pyrinomonadaceae bacterium]